MTESEKEKAKSLASFLVSVAVAFMNVGIIAPTIAYIFNIGDFQSKATLLDLVLVYVMITLIIIGFIWGARRILDLISKPINEEN